MTYEQDDRDVERTRDEWLRPSTVVLPPHVPMTGAEIREYWRWYAPRRGRKRWR